MIKYVFLQEYAKNSAKKLSWGLFLSYFAWGKNELRNIAVSNFFAEISAEIKL